jgi:citrate synthase
LKQSRALPGPILEIIRTVKDSHPMDVLRTAVSALAAFDSEAGDASIEAMLRKSVRLTSQVPAIVAAHHRMRQGLEPVAPDTGMGHAANFLYTLQGEPPSDNKASLMDVDMVLHADHGSNASSFASRVVVATGASLHSAITAAIATLSGPAHGGAAEDVMKMAREVGDPAKAASYVEEKQRNREPVMGFGHRVYRAEDPRARHIRERVERLSKELDEPGWFEILQAIVEAMKPRQRRGLYVNVDFYAGVGYYLIGIPQDLFVPIFAIGRVPGWAVQALEHARKNILIRPRMLYTGPEARDYLPIENR